MLPASWPTPTWPRRKSPRYRCVEGGVLGYFFSVRFPLYTWLWRALGQACWCVFTGPRYASCDNSDLFIIHICYICDICFHIYIYHNILYNYAFIILYLYSLNLDRVLSLFFVKRARCGKRVIPFQTKVLDKTSQESFTVELSRQEDDVSSVLKGISTASLEALNYAGYLNEKYAPCSECNLVVRC